MKRLTLAVPVCALVGVKVGRAVIGWPYWLSVFSVIRSFAQPPPARAETEGDYPA